MNIILAVNMEILIVSAVIFTGVILLLIAMLHIASLKLVNQGDVELIVNGESITTSAGSTLLNFLNLIQNLPFLKKIRLRRIFL